jgi:hypothetical protein
VIQAEGTHAITLHVATDHAGTELGFPMRLVAEAIVWPEPRPPAKRLWTELASRSRATAAVQVAASLAT